MTAARPTCSHAQCALDRRYPWLLPALMLAITALCATVVCGVLAYTRAAPWP